MAAVTANADIRKFHTNGGTIVINDGTDTYTLKNIEPGSLTFSDGRYQVHEFVDEGVPQQALVGDALRSRIEFTLRLGDLANATTNTAFDLFNQAPTAGKVKEYTTLVIKVPDYRGASTGTQITYSNVSVVEFATVSSEASGDQHASVRVALHSRSAEGTRAEY